MKQNMERIWCHRILKTDYYQPPNFITLSSSTQDNKRGYHSKIIIRNLYAFLDIMIGRVDCGWATIQ